MSNIKSGNTFEREFCEALFADGWWVYNCPKTVAGAQPADVIAVKNGKAYLIDCKNCEKEYFSKTRIEENQILAMKLFEQRARCEGIFAIKLNSNIYMVALDNLLKSPRTHLKEANISKLGCTLEQWKSLSGM